MIGSKSQSIILSIQILLFSVNAIALSYRILLPYSHIVLSGLLTFLCMIIIMVHYVKDPKVPLLSIIIAGAYFRSIYSLFMGPNVIPLSDPYADYAYTAVSLLNGKVDFYTGQAGILNLGAISQWPLLHAFTVEFVQITGLEVIWSASFVVPMIIWLTSIFFVYIITKYFSMHLGLNSQATLMVTLLYALFPHAIYLNIQFIRGAFGLLWTYMLLYAIARSFMRRSPADKIVLIISSISLAVSHHFSGFLFLLFLLTAWACNKIISGFILEASGINRSKKGPLRAIVNIYPFVLLLWWLFYGTLAFVFARMRFSLYPMEYAYVRQFEASTVLVELRPLYIRSVVLIRDIIVYGFIAIGILYFVIVTIQKLARKDIKKERLSILFLLVAVCLTYAPSALLVGGADKMLAFFAPVLLIFSGFCFHKLNKTRLLFKILLVIAFTMASVGLALAPYSHNYAPIYLYDNSIRPEETNAHNPNYWRVGPFLNSYVTNSSKSYVSDDGLLLYAILPTRWFKHISGSGLSRDYEDLDTGVLIVRFGNYRIDYSFWTTATLHADKIYSSGLPEIWIKR